MSEPTVTLSALFSVTHDEATTAIIKGVEQRVWQDTGLPRWLRHAAAQRAAGVLDRFLQVPVVDIVARGWNTWRRYQKYTDASRFPAGKDYEEKEGAFAIDSEHTPRIELQWNGRTQATISFPITVTLDFEGAVVVIRDRQLQGVKLGGFTVKGRICCEKAILKECRSPSLKLPGLLKFDPPLAIR